MRNPIPTKFLLVAALAMLSLSACAAEYAKSASDLVFLHEFVGPKGQAIGYLYGEPLKESPGAYSVLVITESLKRNSPILYRVERTGLIGADGSKEEGIFDDGSYGFTVALARSTYVVVSCCAVGGGAMDDITIEWKPDAASFSFLRTP